MSTKTEKIVFKAVEVIKALPEGIRYSELVRTIQQDFPDIPNNTTKKIFSNYA